MLDSENKYAWYCKGRIISGTQAKSKTASRRKLLDILAKNGMEFSKDFYADKYHNAKPI